eukprot:14176960-Alexandrium_andersonii.AAC.1
MAGVTEGNHAGLRASLGRTWSATCNHVGAPGARDPPLCPLATAASGWVKPWPPIRHIMVEHELRRTRRAQGRGEVRGVRHPRFVKHRRGLFASQSRVARPASRAGHLLSAFPAQPGGRGR